MKGADKSAPASTGAIYKYCIERTALARAGKTDPIVGRDKETRMMMEILGRRTKPNVMIIGEAGVGKTALIDGLALDIINKQVPERLAEAQVFELDLGALIAGASYKGEIEDRLKNILKEVKQFPKAVIFIDEIHVLLDSKGGSIGAGAANLLKPELARGELTVIGATTLEEYRKFIESDPAFNRRFEVLQVGSPMKWQQKECWIAWLLNLLNIMHLSLRKKLFVNVCAWQKIPQRSKTPRFSH